MKKDNMYDFYAEIYFIKIVLWVFFTFVWLLMTVILTGVGTGYFDSVIERTNIYFFYIFWLGFSVTAYIFLYINAYKRGKKILKSIAMCLGAMALLLSVSWCSVKLTALSYKHFSAETWKECKNVRKYMIADLINNHNVIGMDVDEAIKLLGEPDNYNDNPMFGEKGIIYYSGRYTYTIKLYIEDNKIAGYNIFKF